MEELTGNKRHRLGMFGKLVLQVEYRRCDDAPRHLTLWRDATIEDITEEQK